MKIRTLTIMTLVTLLGVAFVYGQGLGKITIAGNIPFEFSVGKKTFPAGNYTLGLSRSSGGFPTLSVSGASGEKTTATVMTKLGGSSPVDEAKLVFDTFDSTHVLSEVWIPGEGGLLIASTSKEHSHQTVTAVVSGPASKNLTGDKIYAGTCAKCHGPKGQGNPDADKFYKVAIPRLNSAEVQAKSDEEIRDIISHGKRNMPPVRIGEATVQHLLQPEMVDAVISYLRTFKQ